ncbi:hypothetical protein ACFYYB_08630 [Streptomyces sp. NPDC002886]|uniref:hypothetical protein n=1 Tax=Streptomyces sp. NPDC002886 TaxID=3364667 RepID=UPI0036AB0D86
MSLLSLTVPPSAVYTGTVHLGAPASVPPRGPVRGIARAGLPALVVRPAPRRERTFTGARRLGALELGLGFSLAADYLSGAKSPKIVRMTRVTQRASSRAIRFSDHSIL